MELPQNLGHRIGILGGTFDPVHNGHLALAEAVKKSFELNSVLFVPSAQPPHKLTYRISSFADRLAMLDLALRERSGFFISDLEAKRLGPSFSIDTLRSLRELLGESVELFFVIGMDAFAEIASWKEYTELVDYTHFVVAARPDQCRTKVAEIIKSSFAGYQRAADESCWQCAGRLGRIYDLFLTPVAVSSSHLRQEVALGHAVDALVPEGVGKFIAAKGLYRF
ncbi:MAG: nicotinate-nucleotide adenylyltransferase [Desulfobulbaceae bacterium]|nr:nicotinate-nucleotide adenylyltransferase [Desulfobulbaceae bacterium]HIJ78222.1 nicotinate (nicotinamide) nucleotide adenylyltransferase [Deltaproteobacteria bacterium]